MRSTSTTRSIDVGNWTITPGIRFESIKTQWHDRPVVGLNGKPVQEKRRDIESNEPLPALSVMYHLSDAWKLFANYETSFGSLQYFQLGQGGVGNQTANGLNPEKAKTYEIGTRYNDDVWGGEVPMAASTATTSRRVPLMVSTVTCRVT